MTSPARALGPPIAAGAAAALVALVAPRVPIAGAALQDVLAVALAAATALAALVLGSRAELSVRASIAAVVSGVACLAALSQLGLSIAAVGPQVAALLVLGRVVGGAVGERVAHPGHVLPATVVAAAADAASLLTEGGPSNVASQSEQALSVLALAAAVPGTTAITFVLGIGDLVMIALLFAVARRHEASERRVTVACGLALLAAFASSAIFARPIPALVPIALFANLAVPAFRKVPKKDVKVAVVASFVAVGLMLFAVLGRR